MEVNIDKAAVERAVVDAVVQSAIGEKIKAGVGEILRGFYRNPVDDALKQVIRDVALRHVQKEYEEQIRAAVRKKLEDGTVEQFVSEFWDAVMTHKG